MFINGFNEACKNIAASSMKVGDESISAIHFWTETKGNLPHLSYIFHKPEQLGTEFNTVACFVTGSLILIEVKRGKGGMTKIQYQKYLGATVACNEIVMEATKGIGKKYRKGATLYCFIFVSSYSSKKLTEAAMEVGDKLIGMIKKNNKGFYKKTIGNLTKD